MRYLTGLILFSWLLSSGIAADRKLGIVGKKAPELAISHWIGPDGKQIKPIQLKDWHGKVVVMEFWQSWCPGCHAHGLPTLKKVADRFSQQSEVKFLTVQTVFEGRQANTKDKLREVQQRHKLKMPMGHDAGSAKSGNRSVVMQRYRSGGTPWCVIVDQEGIVVFNDFHIRPEEAILKITELLKRKPRLQGRESSSSTISTAKETTPKK